LSASAITTFSYDKDTLKDQTDQNLDDFDRITQDLSKFARSASQDNYEEYNSESSYEIRTTALHWWSQDQQRKRWLRLSYMTIDILSISAMSDESERIFSEARRTISWKRAQLEAEIIEKLECLKHWQLSGISQDPLEIVE
jgi:hAT family C-terminal dimerisation region